MSERIGLKPREKLVIVATRKPWLIPILYYIYSYSGLGIDELKEILGLKKQVLRRAIWWLKKYGLVMDSGEKIIVIPDYTKILEEFFQDYCTTPNKHLYRVGGTYYVVNIRRTRITSYTVPAEYIDKLLAYEKNIQTEFSPLDLAQTLNIPINLARKIINAKRILEKCREK